ncbi:P pilus assembly/Cpx signaling pathway [Candidatus Moduliflexus flocculans]|uniref:P pilus assembly/Cpx signaling pathway n=1 Tax=Candidatus Moduliflexus flocculans TaxID=1499966 RepID=A0A081BM98_9BACT|nr:P pilus assembly/Cpx signaling pathway [Candidatus Moduliflexus flocculans]
MKARILKRLAIGCLIASGIGAAAFTITQHAAAAAKERVGMMGAGFMNADVILARMKERLALTEEQEAKLRPMIEEKLDKWRNLHESSHGEMRERFAAMMQERETMWTQMKQELAAILTPEQMAQVEQFREERFGRLAKFAGRFHEGGAKIHEALAALNLTPDQKQQLLSMFMDNRDTRKQGLQAFIALHKELSDLLLTQEFDEQQVRALFQKNSGELENLFVQHAKMLAEMKAILTPEQVEMLKQKQSELFDRLEQHAQAGDGENSRWF